jgi:alpha-glucosidase (family GH31 glycosyl hydrolase)
VRRSAQQQPYFLPPFSHCSCGGDYRSTGADLVRWVEHCAFGTIIRLHGDAHQPWSFDNHTEDTIRNYLNMRYSLMPSLIAAGHTVTESGMPYVTRCDLLHPEFPEAR